MQISVGDKNLESLFSGRQHVIVPGFQRSYAWTLDQVNEYWTDLRDAALREESHFWGPVVLLHDAAEPGEYKLIDGQQRITTAMMTLGLLRDAAFKLSNRIIREGTPGQQDVLNTVRNFLYRPPTYVEPKFTASYLVDAVFKSHVMSDPVSLDKRQRPEITTRGAGMAAADRLATREMRRSYLRLRELMEKFLNQVPEEYSERANRIMSLFTALTSGFEIHSMVLTNEDDAYVLFETLNDRGLQLNPSDLLKTLTLREIRQNKSVETFNQALGTWDQMVENLGEYDFSKFLRHYLLTETDKPVQAKKIFSFFKELIENRNDGAERNLHRLFEASSTYAKLLGIRDIDDAVLAQAITRLNSFSDTHRVLLLAILQASLSEDETRTLFRATEFLAARWVLAGENAQELESFYQTQARKIKKRQHGHPVEAIIEEILEKAPSDNALSALTRTEKADMQRYFLRRLEETFGGLTLSWDKPITIEHLAPQTPGAEANWTEKIHPLDGESEEDFSYDETIRMWGNLTLLEKKLNSSIQNSVWLKKINGDSSTKYDGIRASTLNINRALCDVPDWNRETLESRNTWLGEVSLALVGKDWVRAGEVKISTWSLAKD